MAPDELEVVEVETFDSEKVVQALAGISDLEGLITSTDIWSLIALDAAEALGLPRQNADAVRLVRDKARLRERLHERGLSRGVSQPLSFGATAEEVINQISLPVILKDSAGVSSQNVWLARSEQEIQNALDVAWGAPLRGALFAETYFVGPIYSAETLGWDGHTRLLGVTSRLMSPEPTFLELALAFPVSLPKEREERLAGWLSEVLKAVDYTHGFAHTEFILTESGPEVVEINPRLAGAVVGEAICQTLEHNVYDAFFDLALGCRPALMDMPLHPVRGHAQVLMFPETTGEFIGVEGWEQLCGHPGDPVLYPVYSPGQHIEHLTDQRGAAAFVTATGETAEMALYNVMSAQGKLRVTMRQGDKKPERQDG
ncbi:ATP-grasp domain-containing protein [Streptomyces mirabilis]|uniref:ATP-grasp domain-containing protein n=1 Tax=Streptomyces mirabilis TaxID=68239 RepID=UPI0036E7B6AD